MHGKDILSPRCEPATRTIVHDEMNVVPGRTSRDSDAPLFRSRERDLDGSDPRLET